MKNTVLIPTMSFKRITTIFQQIKKCGYFSNPSKVIIIDNSGGEVLEEIMKYHLSFESHVAFEVISFGKNIGVNLAWNYGLINLEKDHNIIFLNDDIVIRSDFFKKMKEAIISTVLHSIVCPYTAGGKESVVLASKCVLMSKREGWAFAIPYRIASILPLIPKDLFIFCGDDWFWHLSRRFGYSWSKDLSNIIWHEVGQTTKENPDLRRLLKNEKRILKEKLDEAFILIRQGQENGFETLRSRWCPLSVFESFETRSYRYSPSSI